MHFRGTRGWVLTSMKKSFFEAQRKVGMQLYNSAESRVSRKEKQKFLVQNQEYWEQMKPNNAQFFSGPVWHNVP